MALTYELWQENKTRPNWVRIHREELDALTSDDATRVPDAVDAVYEWVDRYDSAVSKALKQNSEDGSDNGESDDSE